MIPKYLKCVLLTRIPSKLSELKLRVSLGGCLQPISAENSTEFLQANNSKSVQHRAMNLTSLDFIGSCESIYGFKPIKDELNHLKDNRSSIFGQSPASTK